MPKYFPQILICFRKYIFQLLLSAEGGVRALNWRIAIATSAIVHGDPTEATHQRIKSRIIRCKGKCATG